MANQEVRRSIPMTGKSILCPFCGPRRCPVPIHGCRSPRSILVGLASCSGCSGGPLPVAWISCRIPGDAAGRMTFSSAFRTSVRTDGDFAAHACHSGSLERDAVLSGRKPRDPWRLVCSGSSVARWDLERMNPASRSWRDAHATCARHPCPTSRNAPEGGGLRPPLGLRPIHPPEYWRPEEDRMEPCSLVNAAATARPLDKARAGG